jgi:plastocyanin
MRLTLLPALPALVALGAVACGGGDKPAASQAQAATPAAPATPAAAAPAAAASAAAAIIEVKMTGNGTTQAAFDPATLSIAAGTTVRFINVTGGPHDIAFWADSVPKGGADVLKKAMANQISDLLGPFLQQPNDKYDVSFAGAPKGLYKGYCLPHLALGMKIAITVK